MNQHTRTGHVSTNRRITPYSIRFSLQVQQLIESDQEVRERPDQLVAIVSKSTPLLLDLVRIGILDYLKTTRIAYHARFDIDWPFGVRHRSCNIIRTSNVQGTYNRIIPGLYRMHVTVSDLYMDRKGRTDFSPPKKLECSLSTSITADERIDLEPYMQDWSSHTSHSSHSNVFVFERILSIPCHIETEFLTMDYAIINNAVTYTQIHLGPLVHVDLEHLGLDCIVEDVQGEWIPSPYIMEQNSL